MKSIENNPNSGYFIGQTFQDNHLLDYALRAYKRAMELNPDLNYDAYLAFIYGEKGEIENMFGAYLNMVQKNETFYSSVQRYAGRFITDDNLDENNILFRKLLLKRLQNDPNDSWNKLLSWLFMQQKDYGKALIQEIALYKRNLDDLNRIIELGDIAFNNSSYDTAKDCFEYVLQNSQNPVLILDANLYLLEIAIETATTNDQIESVDLKFQELFTAYGTGNSTLDLQIAYADFLTFKKNNPDKATTILKDAFIKDNFRVSTWFG